ncbi:MAG: histidine phosphatase family protein, partial [Nitrospirae bacterium]|nr:histidine phosphatase family protein [Nitrospirota bacterium]
MRLIITRHGRTLENVDRRVQGQSPGTLSDEGKVQADKLGNRLKDEKISAIYTSDLKRASETAEIVARYHPDALFFLSKDLRERDYASLVGKTWSEVDWKNIPDDVESPFEMEKRVTKILGEIYSKYKDKTIL